MTPRKFFLILAESGDKKQGDTDVYAIDAMWDAL